MTSEWSAGHGHNRIIRSTLAERRQQSRLMAGQIGRQRRDEIECFWNLTIQRAKSPDGQTMLVSFYHCGEGEPFARWWVISGHLVFAAGETIYGIESERQALAHVKSRL